MDRPLEELPVLTKAALMENFDQLVTDPAIRRRDVEQHLTRTDGRERYLGRFTVSATSGSTGQPGLFLFDPSEWGVLLATYVRPGWWAGVSPPLSRRWRIARLGSPVPWHQTVQVASSFLSPLVDRKSTRLNSSHIQKSRMPSSA